MTSMAVLPSAVLSSSSVIPHPRFGDTQPKSVARALQGLQGADKGDFDVVAGRLADLGFEHRSLGLLVNPETGETIHIDGAHGGKTRHVTLQGPDGQKIKDINYFA